MAIYYPGDNCQNLIPEHLCDPCLAIELAGVRSVAFIDNDFVFTNPESASEWQAGVTAKSIFIIPLTNGTFDGGAPQEGQGFGDNPTTLDGIDFTLNFFDPNFIGNWDFYNNLKNVRNGYKVAFRTSTRLIMSDKAVTVLPKNPVIADVKGKVTWDVTVKWTSQNLARDYAAPANIWNCTQIL